MRNQNIPPPNHIYQNNPPSTTSSPTKRKTPAAPRVIPERPSGIKKLARDLTVDEVKRRLHLMFNLDFDPDDFQVHVIRRVLEGYDSVLIAGTGYGKSLVFEGVAKLAKKGSLVIVICPLKALEEDQAAHARSKGLNAEVLNENSKKTPTFWRNIERKVEMLYVSPEMAISSSFLHLFKSSNFRNRVAVIIVDEAHCIDDWGEENFRPAYRKLTELRPFTANEIPFLACTATCQTETFSLIWDSLGFGDRPFWGVDVGVDRPNLFFHTRVLHNKNNPVLDALNILPRSITTSTQNSEIPKSLFYFQSEDNCRQAVWTLRKCLPAHLRSCIHAFSSSLSEDGKLECWKGFAGSKYRILCATDAAGMGCSVPDVEYAVVFGVPCSFKVVMQRWGRVGRDRITPSTCLLFVPEWAFRPKEPPPNPVVQKLKGKAKAQLEPKSYTDSRAKMDPILEQFVNLADESTTPCSHLHSREVLRPDSQLDITTGLTDNTIKEYGFRSSRTRLPLSWTVLELDRVPSRDRCCGHCNPELAARFAPCNNHDPRLFAFANDFLFPLMPSTCSPPVVDTQSTPVTLSFVPLKNNQGASEDMKSRLRTALIEWRASRYLRVSGGSLFPLEMELPPKQLEELVEGCAKFLRIQKPDIESAHVLAVIKWDSATKDSMHEVCNVITSWRRDVRPIPAPTIVHPATLLSPRTPRCTSPSMTPRRTPPSQRRQQKRTKLTTMPASPTPICRLLSPERTLCFIQPVHSSPLVPTTPTKFTSGATLGITPFSTPLSAVNVANPYPTPCSARLDGISLMHSAFSPQPSTRTLPITPITPTQSMLSGLPPSFQRYFQQTNTPMLNTSPIVGNEGLPSTPISLSNQRGWPRITVRTASYPGPTQSYGP